MANGNGAGSSVRLDKNTAISISLLAVVIAGLLGLLGYIDSRFREIQRMTEMRFETISETLSIIDKRLIDFEHLTGDSWNGIHMKVWTNELERQNRDIGLKVPDPWTIRDQAGGGK